MRKSKMNGMKIFLVTLLLSTAALAEQWKYEVVTDRTNGIYRCGERATFTVTVLGTNGQAVVSGKIKATIDRVI